MKKQLHKLLSIALASVLLASAVACGPSDETDDTTTQTTTTQAETETPESEDTAGTEDTVEPDDSEDTEAPDTEDTEDQGSEEPSKEDPGTDATDDVIVDGINTTGLPIVEEVQTLHVATRLNDGRPSNNDIAFWQELEEATNVHIEWTEHLVSAWAERKAVVAQADDQPDVYFPGMFNDDEILSMGAAGNFIAIDELIPTYMPNLHGYFQENPEWEQSVTAPDGHIYGVPTIMEVGGGHFSFANPPLINQHWLEAVELSFEPDVETPMTLEQFEEVLIAFRDQDPNGNGENDEIPWSPLNVNSLYDFGAAFGFIGNEQFVRDGEVVWAPMTEEYKEFVIWLNGLWEQDLLDPETFTQDGGMYRSKLHSTDDLIGYTTNWRVGSTRYAEDDDRFVNVAPFIAKEEIGSVWRKGYDFTVNRGGALITSDAENPELALRWIDEQLTPQNSLVINSAQKPGEHIQPNEDGTYTQLRPIDWTREGEYSLMPDTPSKIYVVTADEWQKQDVLPPVSIEKDPVEELYNANHTPQNMSHLPLAIWPSLDDAQSIQTILTEVSPYMTSNFALWVTEGGIEDMWDDYIATLDAMGANEVSRINQEYYDALQN